MKKISEKSIETKVCKYAESKGWIVYKFVSPGNRSVPDRIFFKKGLTMFIEFKKPGGKLTVLQSKTIKRLSDEGFLVFVCDNIEDGKGIIDNFYN